MGIGNTRDARQLPEAAPRAFGWILFIALVVAPPLAINAFAVLQPWTDPKFLYRDPLLSAQNQFEWLLANPANAEIYCCAWWWGAISHIGVLVWSATAGALALTFGVLVLRGASPSDSAGFFALAFALTALFATDDLLQIHEQPRLVGPLKGETVIYPLFAALFAGYAFFRDQVLTRHFPMLVLAVACFGVSLSADQVLPQRSATVVIEDSAKLFGIFFWMAFHMTTSARALLGRDPFAADAPRA